MSRTIPSTTDGQWKSFYPKRGNYALGEYIEVLCECGSTDLLIVHDDGNDVTCACGRQYTFVAAHVDFWVPPQPVPTRRPTHAELLNMPRDEYERWTKPTWSLAYPAQIPPPPAPPDYCQIHSPADVARIRRAKNSPWWRFW